MRHEQRTAVCLVTDASFLLPTIIAAREMRRWVDQAEVQVFIFTINVPDALFDCAGRHVGGIAVLSRLPERELNLDMGRTHVSLATFARFYIHEYLPSNFVKLLYVDGDTLAIRDPVSLLKVDIPDGMIGASEDRMWYYRDLDNGFGREIRDYTSTLGIDINKGYFNAGLLFCSTKSWRDISKACITYLRDNYRSCKYHDQSALNKICQDRRIILSPRWNFGPDFCNLGLENEIEPSILHFVGAEKPWLSPTLSWYGLYSFYREAADGMAGLTFSRANIRLHFGGIRNRIFHEAKARTVYRGRRAQLRRRLITRHQQSLC